MSDHEFLLSGKEERIARIALDRPEKRNALKLGIREEMKDALKTAERNGASEGVDPTP